MSDFPGALSTIRDWIRWGASQFNQAELFTQFADALAEAQLLVLHAIHLKSDAFTGQHTDFFASTLTEAEAKEVHALLLTRIQTRKPAAYLTHYAWFAGLSFYVDERVLVPRSPIAELIEQHFSPWIDYNQVGRVLDLCTGSGCIAIACAYAFPDAKIDAVDLSEEALAVAEINRQQHGVEKQLSLHQGDLFGPLPSNTYDIIVSNPPYVDAEDMAKLPAEIGHEPALGLAAGENGLSVAIPLLQQAVTHLSEHGILVLEVGNSQEALETAYPQAAFTWLEFSHGGHGVCVLTRQQLADIAW